MFTLTQETQTQGNIVSVRATGRLTYGDYQHFTEEMERRMRMYGRIRVLMDLQDFHGWDFGAAWADFTFGLKHLGHLERCAVVGDKKWEEWLTDLGKPFFQVRYFDRSEEAKAWEWLREPEEAKATTSWLNRCETLLSQHPIACAVGGVALGFLLWNTASRRLGSR